MARELGAVADAAPDRRVPAEAEVAAVRLGRVFTRRALEAALKAQVGATLAAGVSAAGQAAVDDLINYCAKHTERLSYYRRLQAGRSVGSGAVEGLARRIGDRLKTAGRGWREDHLDPKATLVNLMQMPEWLDH